MRQFKDKIGVEWSIEIGLPIRKQVKAELGVDLFAVGNGDLMEDLSDPEKLGDVLYLICKEQADKINITTGDAFAGRFSGDTLESASEALIEAIIDFFPNRQRQILSKALATGKAEMETKLDKIMQALENPSSPSKSSGISTDAPA